MASDPVPTDAEISRPPVGSFRELVSAGFVTTLLFAAFLVFPIVGALALITVGLAWRPAAGGRPMKEEVAAAFDEMAPSAVQSYTRSGMDAEAVAKLKATLAASRDFASRFWVGLVGVTWVLASAIGFYTGARLARPSPSAEAVRFEALAIPPAAVAPFVAAGA